MNNFKFFSIIKDTLCAANNTKWTHMPQRDRLICDDLTLSFAKFEGDKETMVLDIVFDTAYDKDIFKYAVAELETNDGCRVLHGQDIPFVKPGDFFDMNQWLMYSDLKE
jgi:hypothetical protein